MKTRQLLSWLPLLVGRLFLAGLFGCSAADPAGLPAQNLPDHQVRLDAAGRLVHWIDGQWQPLIGQNYPVRVLGQDPTPQPRPLTSFSNSSPALWTLTTPFEGYRSVDQGQSWTLELKREALKPGANLTAFGQSMLDPQLWAAGTSFHGLWLSSDAGKTWIQQPDLEVAYPYNDGSKEQINALAFSARDPHRLYVAVGKTGERLWILDSTTGAKRSIPFPGGGPLLIAEALAVHLEGEQEMVDVRTRTAWWRYAVSPSAPEAGQWTKLLDRTDGPVFDAAKQHRMDLSRDKAGYYVSAPHIATPELLKSRLDFMARNGLNALVVDFKDDFGEIKYDSEVPLAQKAGAVNPIFDARALIKAVHQRGFYLIARQVVFKDKKLYRYNNNQFALWDSTTKKPWGFFETVTAEDGTSSTIQKEFWVDSYSADVWAYNIALAQEMQSLGVDEIQFDYIRFPSDGPVNRIVSRAKVEGMSRIDALESFLKGARSALSLPISVDIYGYNGYFVTDHLGQNMAMMARYVDAISPMFYPSHFWKTFLPTYNYFDRAQIIYQDGSDRCYLNTQGQVHVRPWVQTFRLGGERKFTDQQGWTYVERQLIGVQKSKASGFLLWNSSNDYYMVTHPVTPYLTTTP